MAPRITANTDNPPSRKDPYQSHKPFCRAAVSDQHRKAAHPQSARPADRQARHPRRPALPVPDHQDDHATRPAPHRGDAPPARRRRHHRYRALARTRTSRNHTDVPPRRPRDQGTSTSPHQAAGQQTRPLPPDRRTPRIPGWTVTRPQSTRISRIAAAALVDRIDTLTGLIVEPVGRAAGCLRGPEPGRHGLSVNYITRVGDLRISGRLVDT
jgi:hypothetical protein